jgi:hypothetical protein
MASHDRTSLMAKGRRAKGAKAKTPGWSRQAARRKAVPAAPPKPKEEAAPEVVATKPVVKPPIGLSDIGRLAKSAIGSVLALVTPKSHGRKRTAIKSEKSAKPVKSRRKGAALKPT